MKKLKVFSRLLLFVMALALVFVAAACFNNTEANPPKVESITLNQTTAEITLGEELDYSKFTVTVHYDDATKNENLPLTAEMITEGLSSLNTVGVHPLTVTAKGKTATLTVTVKPAPKAAVSISLNKSSAEITVGDDINYSEFTVTVNYDDGSQDSPITLEERYITDGLFNLGTVGTHELIVTVMGKTAKLTVKVNPLVMTNVTMANVTKTYDGQPAEMNPTGLPAGAQVAYTYYAGEAADESKKVERAVDAGTYFVKAVVSATNYEDKELTATITINKQHISVNNVIWNNTGYRYTGEEVTLAAKATNLPEYITYTFTAKAGGAAKATESGYYTAVAHFTSTNNNYSVDASCELTWRIIQNTSLAFAPWYGAENGQLLVATFEEFENNNNIVLHLGEETVTGTVEYTATTTVTFPEETGYTLTVDEGVMTLTKGNNTRYLLSESTLNNFVGEYSTLVEVIKVALDVEEDTLKLVVGSAEHNLTIGVASNTVQLTSGEDIVLTYNAEAARVKFNGYANPADFNQVDKDGIYLLTKEEVEALKESLNVGTYVDYENRHSLSVAADKTFKYDGKSVQPFAVYYVASSSYYTSGVKLYVGINTNNRKQEVTVYDDFYKVSSSMFIPADYKNFFGTYYPKTETGFDTATANKVAFMEYGSYYRVTVGSTNYDVDKGELSFSLTDGVLTATLTKGEAESVSVTFNGGESVTIGDKTYSKVKVLFSTSSYTYFYNIANGQYIKDNGNGTVKIYGTDYQYKDIDYTANGVEITITVGGEDKKLIANGDARYITYDGVVHVSDNIASVSNGRINATYSNGADKIEVSNTAYKLTVGGVTSSLTDLVYSIADDGNNNGRTVIKVTGKIGEDTYTILHYSLATVLVNGKAYAHSTFVDIMGSEFKPTADSEDVFAYAEDGKMTFRGTEIFLNGASSYTNFNFTDNYYYSFDISKTNISFNDQIVWNVKYYFAAYFDFNGAYKSEDGTKVFFFDESTIYYNETSTTSFKAMGTATGAKVTISSKDAIFTKAADGAITLVYDGVTYNKVSGFNFASYYGSYTGFDGSSAGVAATVDAKTTVQKLVMFNGEITPVISVSYNTFYLIKNTDAATSAQLPVMLIQDRFVTLPASTTFQGKPLTIQIKAVQKADSTEYMASVAVLYDGATSTLNFQYGTYSTVIDGVKYVLQANSDSATKEQLPLLVFEAWLDDFDGSYTYNGKTLKVEIVVDASGEAPVPALKFTYDNEVVTATITDVEGGKQLTFTKGGVNYKGVMSTSNSIYITVYSETAYNFFFANEYKHTVNGKELVFVPKVVSYPSYSTECELSVSSYDGKVLTYAKYFTNDVLVFETEDGSFAYDLVEGTYWADVMDFDASLVGISLTNGSTISGYNTSGSDLYYSDFKTILGDFDKTTGKITITATMGWNKNYPATLTKIDDNTFKVEGKNYNGKEIVAYLTINGSTKLLITSEEYLFAGTHSVDGKNLIIAKTADGKYTASYDSGDAVAVTPDFSNHNFVLKTTDKTYAVSWTYTTEFTFTVTEVSAEAMSFVGSGSSAYIGYTDQDPYDLTITYTGNDTNGKATYSIKWSKGYSSSGTVTGTLSDDGQKIIASEKINSNNMYIYLNKNSDKEIKYIMIMTGNSVTKLIGKFAMGDSEVVINVDTTPTYDYDDELDGYERTKLVVTLDGKACTVTTAWSTSASTVEFTCEGKTYTATYASGSVTVAEKAAA